MITFSLCIICFVAGMLVYRYKDTILPWLKKEEQVVVDKIEKKP